MKANKVSFPPKSGKLEGRVFPNNEYAWQKGAAAPCWVSAEQGVEKAGLLESNDTHVAAAKAGDG